MNSLVKLRDALKSNSNEIDLPREVCERAVVPIKRLLDFAAELNTGVVGRA